MPNALVTGGSGFIGSNLVDALLKEGYRLRVLDNLSNSSVENLKGVRSQIDFIDGDIRDLATVEQAASGVELVFHLAAVGSVPRSIADPETTTAVNLNGTVNVLRAAVKVKARRVIFSSSSSIYGDTPTLPKSEEMPLAPISPYGASKAAAEVFLHAFAAAYKLETINLRYFNVFGPRQSPKSEYAAAIPRFLAQLEAGKAITIFGDGEQSRDFTYVENVVQANLLAAKNGPGHGEAINIAASAPVTVNDLAKRIATAMGVPLKVEHLAPRAGDIRHSHGSIQRARDLLHFTPTVGLDEGLRRTVAWFRTQS